VKAAICRVVQFADAIGTNGQVRRNPRDRRRLAPTRADFEFCEALRRGVLYLKVGDARRGRRTRLQSRKKSRDAISRRFRVNFHSGRVIEDPARYPVLQGTAVNERPKTDALHDAADCHAASNSWIGFHRTFANF
jgi:hypothetical protein